MYILVKERLDLPPTSTKVERKPNGIKIVDDDEEEEETVAEKRLRLAKQYIAQVEEEGMSLHTLKDFWCNGTDTPTSHCRVE